MKRLILSFLMLFSLIAFNSCSDELLDIKFGLNTKQIEFTLQPQSQAGTFPLEGISIPVNLDSFAEANNANISKIKSIKVKSMKLEIIDPATANFDIIEGAVGFLEADGLPKVELGKIENIADQGLRAIDLVVTDVNLMDYLKKPTITVSGQLTTSGPTTEPIKLKAIMEFEVIANPIN